MEKELHKQIGSPVPYAVLCVLTYAIKMRFVPESVEVSVIPSYFFTCGVIISVLRVMAELEGWRGDIEHLYSVNGREEFFKIRREVFSIDWLISLAVAAVSWTLRGYWPVFREIFAISVLDILVLPKFLLLFFIIRNHEAEKERVAQHSGDKHDGEEHE